MRKRLSIFFLFSLFGLLAVGLGFWIGHLAQFSSSVDVDLEKDPFPFEVEAISTQFSERDSLAADIRKSRQNAITHTVALVSPAVVGINVTQIQEYTLRDPFEDFFSDPFFRQFFGDRERSPRKYRQEIKGLGSGFIISPDGYIVTNDHVTGGASEIVVTLTNAEKHNAILVGSDPVSDIALLKIKGNNFPYTRLGNSDDVIIGEWVIAFGNPFGLFDISNEPTVTVGVVSATKMNISAQRPRIYRGMVQTDAAINRGNSGGPLSNALGEVIGMNTIIYTPNQGNIGVGFAIPINRVKTVVTELKKKGKVERDFWTGLRVQEVDESIAKALKLVKAEGVIVNEVQKGSPAERAGLKVGDVILEVNGEKISGESAMLAVVNSSRSGEVLHLKVFRDKNLLSFDLKLDKRSS